MLWCQAGAGGRGEELERRRRAVVVEDLSKTMQNVDISYKGFNREHQYGS
jgi:hypothetical protein